MKLSLVIPFYNEREILRETFSSVTAFMTENYEDFEVLFVSDGSSDGSSELLCSLGEEAGASLLDWDEKTEKPEGRVFCITYKENRGKGHAVRVGMTYADGDLLVFTDCDLAYGLEQVKLFVREMLTPLRDGTLPDLAIASRPLHPEGYEGYPFIRKLASKCYLLVLKCYGGLSVSDSQAGLKAFWRDTYKFLSERYREDGFAFDFELLLIAEREKLSVKEIPSKVVIHRESKVSVIKDAKRMLKKMKEIKKRWKKDKKERS